MPDIYDIDFNQQAVDLLPPDKRDPQPVTLAASLLKGVQWARDLILGNYKKGSTASPYSPGTYNKYDQVLYNKALYESLIDTNTDAPTVTTSWRMLLPNFIGVDERVKYNGQKIVLEYALNKEFDGVFRQPGSSSPSDIYLTNVAPTVAGFHVGQTEAGSSSIGQTTSSDSIGGSYPFVQISNFQINFKASLFVLTNEKAVRNFVNKYIPISINYIIVTY